jgi:hypothetical protein
MKRFFIALIAAVAINYFYPQLLAPAWDFADKTKRSFYGLTAYPMKKNSSPNINKWVVVPKTFSFTDVRGQSHSFSGENNKPAVLAFWVDECGYSQNAMLVLNAIRRAYPETQLDVIGFFLNERGESEVITTANKEGYSVTLVAAQPPGAREAYNATQIAAQKEARARPGATKQDIRMAFEQTSEQTFYLIKALHRGFMIRGPGRDIYIIGRKGLIHTIPTVDEKDERKSQKEIITRVENILQKVFSRT